MLISIVTVCFNDLNGLKNTIKSISDQKGKQHEHIIVDGYSTDGTVEYLDTLPKKVIRVSEKDNGIYDAMNKGIGLCSGKYIIFMNSGDVFFEDSVLEKAETLLITSYSEFLYGDVYTRNGLVNATELNSLWSGMCFSHQSVFILASYHKANLYDDTFTIAADYNLIFSSYLKQAKFEHINFPVASVESGGISEQLQLLSTWERFRVVRGVRSLFYKVIPYYSFTFFKILLKVTLKKILKPL